MVLLVWGVKHNTYVNMSLALLLIFLSESKEPFVFREDVAVLEIMIWFDWRQLMIDD